MHVKEPTANVKNQEKFKMNCRSNIIKAKLNNCSQNNRNDNPSFKYKQL